MTTGKADNLGLSHFPDDDEPSFQIPWNGRGGPKDIGSLALFLVANWFVNGEFLLWGSAASALTSV